MASVRRLTAILAADVAGYSRLMGADEEGTHARLQGHLRELIDPKIAEHRGRVRGQQRRRYGSRHPGGGCSPGIWRRVEPVGLRPPFVAARSRRGSKRGSDQRDNYRAGGSRHRQYRQNPVNHRTARVPLVGRALGAVDIAVLAEQRGAMAAARPGRTAAGDPFERGEPRCGSRARTASIAAAGPGPVSARRTRNAAAGRSLRPPFVAARSRRLGAALRTTLVNISAFGVTLTPHRP